MEKSPRYFFLDSVKNFLPREETKVIYNTLCKVVGIIYDHLGSEMAKKGLDKSMYVPVHKNFKFASVPRQLDTWSCGYYMLSFMEALIKSENGIDTLDRVETECAKVTKKTVLDVKSEIGRIMKNLLKL